MGAGHADPITPASFSIGVVLCTAVGTVLATVLARRAADPARAFLRTALVLTVVSLVFPLTATHTVTATRLTLALGHVVAAALIIPILVSSLSGHETHANRSLREERVNRLPGRHGRFWPSVPRSRRGTSR
jgi:heme A synthase